MSTSSAKARSTGRWVCVFCPERFNLSSLAAEHYESCWLDPKHRLSSAGATVPYVPAEPKAEEPTLPWPCLFCPESFDSLREASTHADAHTSHTAVPSSAVQNAPAWAKAFKKGNAGRPSQSKLAAKGKVGVLSSPTPAAKVIAALTAKPKGLAPGAAVCQHCGGVFAKAEFLESHFRSCRRRPKEYACAMCGAAFSYRSSLTLHIRSAHAPPSYPCTEAGCGLVFKRPGDRQRHERRHARENTCPLCPATFDDRDARSRHVGAVHGGVTPVKSC